MSRSNKIRRQEKLRQLAKRAKQRHEKRLGRQALGPHAAGVVEEAEYFIGRGQWNEARKVLEEHERERPGDPRVLRLLLDIYHEQGDFSGYARCCERLLELTPSDRSLQLALAGAYLSDARMATALREFRRFVERWPNDPMSGAARATIAQLETALDEAMKDCPFPREDRVELGAMHEEVMAGLQSDDGERTIAVGEQLMARSPEFIPVRNNLAELYFRSARFADAIALSRQVLEREPENFHALANLSRYLLLTGQRQEADEVCNRLRAVRSDNFDIWTKKAETLSYFGDDDGVLNALEEASRVARLDEPRPGVELLHHLAAVAAARKGNDELAQREWSAALEVSPRFQLAIDNLADARRPIGKREGPWAFGVEYWIPEQTFKMLRESIANDVKQRGESTIEQRVKTFVERHPEFLCLIPDLLDRGDPSGRSLAAMLARELRTPEMIDALRQFCGSQRGSDKLRISTANFLSGIGAISRDRPIRLWSKGEWRDVEVLSFEVTEEPMHRDHTEQVDAWGSEGLDAAHDGDGERAEALFRKCIEVEGEKPDLLTNLAAALLLQRRTEEATQLQRHIHERWPDYFFGRVAMAHLAIDAKDFERAKELLSPLRQRTRMHTTEFTALMTVYVRLFEAQGMLDAARSWLGMWRQILPDDPQLHELEWRIEARNESRPLLRRIAPRMDFARGEDWQ